MKPLKYILLITAGFVITASLGVYLYLKSTLPDYDGKLATQGVHSSTEILRDPNGVPHIFAKNDEDAYFALGYCMAQDRLFQMELGRLLAQGRLSEMMGKKTLETDKLFRAIYCAHDWEKIMRSRSPRVVQLEDAFIRGINAFLERGNAVPALFTLLRHRPEPYTPKDIALMIPFYSWMTTCPLRPELFKMALIDKVGVKMAEEFYRDKSDIAVIPRGEPCYPGFAHFNARLDSRICAPSGRGMGDIALSALSALSESYAVLDAIGIRQASSACNNLVISGRKTASGKPLLVQDFHFPYTVPSYLYEASMSTPENKVAGYIFAGQPYVIAGRNEHVAWAFTAGCGDQADLYIEKINPKERNEYLYRGKYEKMRIRKEVIRVKGGGDVAIEVRFTRHGPVIDHLIKELKPKLNGSSLAIRLTSFENFQGTEAAYRMTTARSADDLLRGLYLFRDPDEHWVYADDRGEIGYIYSGAIPVRIGFDGTVALLGWTGRFEWNGLVPAAKQPQLKNPRMGFINTSNTKAAPDYYPYPQGNNHIQSDRQDRVRECVNETIARKGNFGIDDVNSVYSDCTNLRAREWVPLLLEAAKGAQLNKNEEKTLGLLAEWNFRSHKDSAPAAVFQAMLVRMVMNMFRGRLGEELFKEYTLMRDPTSGLKNVMKLRHSPWFDDPNTRAVENRGDFLLKSFREAVHLLEERLGRDAAKWQLGDLLTLIIRHPLSKAAPVLSCFLDIGPIRVGGGTISPYNTTCSFLKPFEVIQGTQARLVVDFSERRNCKIVTMPGISENFMSPHYRDQVGMWDRLQFRPLVLYRDEAVKEAKYTLMLLPR